MTDSLHSTSRGHSIILSSLPRRSPTTLLIALLKQSSSPSLRTFRAANELILLLQELPFFADLAHNYRLMSELAQRVEYAHRDPQEYVYRMKERADYFYVVIQGRVQLTIPEQIGLPQEQEGGEYLDQKEIFPAFFQVPEVQEKQQPKQEPIPRQFVQKIVRVIEQGGCFGQMMSEVSLRATNAIAMEECHFLSISKKAYDYLLTAQMRTDNRSKFLFLSSIPQLASLRSINLQTIALRLQERSLLYGQALFQEGEQIRTIFIVQSGEFRLTKTVAKHSACGLERRTRGRSQYQCLSLPTKEAPFVIVQAGQVLGDGQVLALQQVYQQRCVCQSQQAKVYTIDKREYFKALTTDRDAFQRSRKVIEDKFKRRCAFAQSFLQRRSKQSPMNSLLNSNQWASKPRQFIVRDPSIDSSVSSLTSQQILANEAFFLNSFNRTFAQQDKSQGNRFSINKQKCLTETASPKVPPLIKNKKKDGLGVPHCVQDIVSIVRLKANFLRRFRKERKRERNVFKFDKDAVPLFIKSKYNKIQDSK